MKKHVSIVAIVFFLLMALSLNAQNFHFGVVGGPYFADINLTDADGNYLVTSSKTYFGVGAVLDFPLGWNVHLNFQPMFIKKGGLQMGDPNAIARMYFIEVPLFMKITFGKAFRPFIKAGPTLGVLLCAEGETEETGGVVGDNGFGGYKTNSKAVLRSFELGIAVGAGIGYAFDGWTVFLDGRYAMGLNDLYKGGTLRWEKDGDIIDVEKSSDRELKTKGFQIMFGVIFPFGGK